MEPSRRILGAALESRDRSERQAMSVFGDRVPDEIWNDGSGRGDGMPPSDKHRNETTYDNPLSG